MPVDRPTFHESWYRVVDQTPSLRSTVQTYRQVFRGQTWHVVRDPSNNQFFRLSEDAYHFVGLLDGRRTVGEVWAICNEQLGDRAPTQGEVIQTLGQLFTVNLLRGNLPPDTQSLFDRYKKRRVREVGGYLSNFLFVRIPVFDPDRVLGMFVGVFGWVFSIPGLIFWLVLLTVAGYFVLGQWHELLSGVDSVLKRENIIPLYLCFAGIKAIHEFGHGFASKKFGQISGDGGEMHVMGIMLLVFMPVPYVDASSSWAFRNKWHRMMVSAAGMYVELAVAAVAAIIWARTTEGTTLHAISYNLIFIASVSTLLFNGNPLLRFDGYYVLSDLLEIPNMYQRSRDRLYYLVKRYVYGVRRPRNPAYTRGEQIWFVFYAIAAFCYRVFISIKIILFIAGSFFYVGVVLAMAAIVMWAVVPLGKLFKYLASNPELARVQSRAAVSSLMAAAVLVLLLGIIPAPDYGRAEGVVEPENLRVIHLEVEGFVDQVQPSGTVVHPDGPPVIIAHNHDLEIHLKALTADEKLTRLLLRDAEGTEPDRALVLRSQLKSLEDKIEYIKDKIDALKVRAPFEGVWVSPQADRLVGSFIRPGDEVGMVATTDNLILRIVADQWIGPRIQDEIDEGETVEIRVKGNPDITLTGTIEEKMPAGTKQLPSQALGYLVGGSVEVALDDPEGRTAKQAFFEIVLHPNLPPGTESPLRPGQRVVARFTFGPRPLALQWWRAGRQLFEKNM